ncbi:hypothetical protein P0O24_06730 [Methanotrichaceae archaeon M04Ac]|uniref:Uncharacterized protein n=1 Tax=Candidatus Methanocrinis alkalitolerans TaxID=3033395 RepID=A0ABT5XF43_9EURY|nr:hypothetical protein [Candidatus Methanocrinis alkalitolerans]MDF0593275.1 hypothetical protein [Candidatus Methanocrinis alkalitolerans]
MQPFAVASVYPRSIAWIIRPNDPNEWDRFEQIIKYNCAMVGGYFNVIIPLSGKDEISEKYQQFMINFDPDLIVLAPDMDTIQPESFLRRICPFALIPWDSVSQIAAYNPWDIKSGTNATLRELKESRIDDDSISTFYIAAVAKEEYPDASRLALVACGDIESGEASLRHIDKLMLKGGITTNGCTGYRESFLGEILESKYKPSDLGHKMQNGDLISPPDRYKLADIICDGNQFPLTDAVKILSTCCRMQTRRPQIISFIRSTIDYSGRYFYDIKVPCNMVILVSDSFGLDEAVLFWNLRANEIYVIWLSFKDLEEGMENVGNWLGDLLLGSLYVDHGRFRPPDLDLAFSSRNEDIERLNNIFEKIKRKKREISHWGILTYEELVFYSFIKPHVKSEHVLVARDSSKCMFLPNMPSEMIGGIFTITLEWEDLMLPQKADLIKLISSENVEVYDRESEDPIEMPSFRITKNNFIRVQTKKVSRIKFNKPLVDEIIKTSFLSSGFSRIERSSSAKYHTDFINRAGSLEEAARYLATSPYREFFELLSDNRNENRPGWLLGKDSDKRRALHHYHLRESLGITNPPETKTYVDKVSDLIPDEIIELLEKRILERGFELKCKSCSFKSWYPAEYVGQTFECTRCYQSQVLGRNPLWLYKLSEVTFQGLTSNMDIPLLALNYLRKMARHDFEWIPDSDVYWTNDEEENNRNIDILCILDGKLFIGEAKSNDEIPDNQFSFYDDLCKSFEPDGIVFATSKSEWKQGTKNRIEKLREWFKGEVIELTSKELYPSQPNENA